jgi:hypothetical protein
MGIKSFISSLTNSNRATKLVDKIIDRPPVSMLVRGLNCADWAETIKNLNRNGKREEASALAYECHVAHCAENNNSLDSASWYKSQINKL